MITRLCAFLCLSMPLFAQKVVTGSAGLPLANFCMTSNIAACPQTVSQGTVGIFALNTAVAWPVLNISGTSAKGLLIVSDVLHGGVALVLLDPNFGPVAIANQIANFTLTASGMSLTAGTVPVTLSYTFIPLQL